VTADRSVVADSMTETLPADSDLDLRPSFLRAGLTRTRWAVLSAISVGGALGALGRYGLSLLLPATPTGFPWGIFLVNVSGCLLIGVLMVLVTEVWTGRRLLRPFLGVGVLGGYTTFSTYVVDIQRLVNAGAAGTALAYLAGTAVFALLAVWIGLTLGRVAVRRRRREAR
jgi:CrcB protein